MSEDLIFDTLHTYVPTSLIATLSVFSYVPVTELVTIWEVALSVVFPLVQKTVVAGPPVEVQVRVNTGVLAFVSESVGDPVRWVIQ